MGDRDVTKIEVTYSDGTVKELEYGCCVDLRNVDKSMTIDMLNCKPIDIIRLAYGLMVCVEKLEMKEELMEYARAEVPENAEDL